MLSRILAAVLVVLPCLAIAEEKPAAAPAAPAATQKIYSPTDLATLREQKGKAVTVEGTISGYSSNKADSIRYLNFTKHWRDGISLVFFVNDGAGTFTKEKLSEYVGKKVRVTGTVSDFKGALQIKIAKLDQMAVQP